MDTFPPPGPGSGRSLPAYLLFLCACATIFTCVASTLSVWLQLKHYYRPMLQRYVVRILILPPLYAVASTISLFSLQLAEMIDLLRDLYEAFVIYCFFNLLIEYLSSEGSILIMLRGRPPTPHFFPLNLFLRPLDLSDPRMFLMLKRGILQYVQVKPILALVTVLLKVLGEYHEGHLQPQSGYTWTALVYNVSVFLALYCLALFWAGLSEDLAPFRVGAKFLCVKGVIFFSFWQGLCISILVSSGIVKRIGGVVDDEYLSTALQDTLICLEMPFFAVLHTYAFSYSDYVEPPERMAGRLPIPYALRDSLGVQDLVSDWAETLRGSAYTYRKWEASDNVVYHPYSLERRGRAGLRYADGGKHKYWVEEGPVASAPQASTSATVALSDERTPLAASRSHAHYTGQHESHVPDHDEPILSEIEHHDTDNTPLSFDDPTESEDELYETSRKLPYGDYGYPCIGELGYDLDSLREAAAYVNRERARRQKRTDGPMRTSRRDFSLHGLNSTNE